MAKNQIKMLTEGSSNDGPSRFISNISNTSPSARLALALTVALTSPVATANQEAQAADFRHVKKIIVPATSIPRRYDYDTAGGREAGLPAGYGSGYSPQYPNYDSGTSSSSSGKSGLVPPPPPVTPSLLPASLAHDIPAPPSSKSQAASTSSTNAHQKTISAGGYQQVNADPTRKTAIQQHTSHTQASKSHKLGSDSTTVNTLIARADELEKEGKLQESQELLEKYEKTYPHNAALENKLSEVSLARAKYYMRHDDYVEGAKQARIALAHNSANTEAKHALEQMLRHHGVDPHHALSRVKMGDLLFSQGKLKEARVEYESALKVDHAQAAHPHIGLGNIALRENRLKEAKSHYQLALEKEPESSVALRQMGIVRYKLKDVVGANADLSRALVLNQDDKVAGQTLVELWQRQVSMHPTDANSHLGLARAYQLSGALQSAQNSYRTVVSIDPNHPNLPAARQSFKLALSRQEAQKTYEAAKTLEQSGAIPEAYNKSAEAVSLSPGEIKFRMYQAELAERLGNLPEAKHLYLEVLRQDSKNTVAASKIKSLSEMLGNNDTSQTLRGPIGAAPPVMPSMPSTGLEAQPGILGETLAAAQGASPAIVSSMMGTPGARIEGPPLATIPAAPGTTPKIPSADPIQNMTGFLSDLRGYMFQQKKDLQTQEDTVLEAIGAKPKSSKGASEIAKMPDLPKLPDLPKNLISSSDVQKLLAGTSTTGGAVAGATAGAAAVAGLQPTTVPAPSTFQLSQSLPPLNVNPDDSILSPAPRRSETVLKVAEPVSTDQMPPVAPPRGSFQAPPVTQTPAMPQEVGLIAQAQSLSPEALHGIARSLGMDPAVVTSMASQAMQQAPQLISAAPALLNKGIANLKQEDIDKVANLIKNHVAAKQQAMGITPKPPQVVKKVQAPKSDPKSVKPATKTAAKPAAKTTPAKVAAPPTNPPAVAAVPVENLPEQSNVPAQAYFAAPPVTPMPLPAPVDGNASAMPQEGNNPDRMGSLEAQNRELTAQLENTRKELQELRESLLNNKAAKPTKAAKQSKKSKETAPTSSMMPQAFSPAQSSLAAPAPPLDSSDIVNLELAGVNVKSREVRLNVVLRNGTGKSLVLPSNTKAVVRMVGMPDQTADVKFPVRSLTPGQEAKGYISVNGHRLDPSADVFIPKLISTESGPRDVHLTVPISALSSMAPN